MNDPRILQILTDAGAIVSDSHFVYTSGRHGSVYVNKDALYVHPEVISLLCECMAEAYAADSIDVVVAPVLGGIVLSQWVAHALNQRRTQGETLAVFVEKSNDNTDKRFLFTRGYDKYIANKNILVVEDILSTGGSVRQVVELVRQHSGNIIGVSALCNRGNVQPHDIGNVPLTALINIDLQTYAAEVCPFCKSGVPVNVELGKGRAFLEKKMWGNKEQENLPVLGCIMTRQQQASFSSCDAEIMGHGSIMQKNVTPPTFLEKLTERWQQGHFVCVGLDVNYEQLPAIVKEQRTIEEAIFIFNRVIIDATANLVCAYKPNSAFYEAYGEAGIRALSRTISYSLESFPHIPIILDAKRADIGSTNTDYVHSAFDELGADAITVHPYLGKEALAPFLARKDKGIIVLAKTSNPGSGEFQDLLVGETQEPLYQVVARNVAQEWNGNGNCALVVGATYPAELRRVREIVGDMPLLIPGIGAQGGDVAATVAAGQDSRGWGMIINSSRGIIYASRGDDFAQAAYLATVRLGEEINGCRG